MLTKIAFPRREPFVFNPEIDWTPWLSVHNPMSVVTSIDDRIGNLIRDSGEHCVNQNN